MLVSITNPQLGTFTFNPPLVVVDPLNPVLFNVIQPGGDPVTRPWTANYSRRWTYTGGASPFGIKLNGFTHRRIQPEVMGNGGFLISPRNIPVEDSSSFNFTFQLGAGLQWYRTPTQSIQAEIRYHHLSNGDLGPPIQAWIRCSGKRPTASAETIYSTDHRRVYCGCYASIHPIVPDFDRCLPSFHVNPRPACSQLRASSHRRQPGR